MILNMAARVILSKWKSDHVRPLFKPQRALFLSDRIKSSHMRHLVHEADLTTSFKLHLVPYIPSHLVLVHSSYNILMYNIPIYFYYLLSASSHYIMNPTMIWIFVCFVHCCIPNLRTIPGTINTCWKLNSQMDPYQMLITKVTQNQFKWQ